MFIKQVMSTAAQQVHASRSTYLNMLGVCHISCACASTIAIYLISLHKEHIVVILNTYHISHNLYAFKIRIVYHNSSTFNIKGTEELVCRPVI